VLRLLPHRRTPKLRSRVKRSSYPRGYTLEEIGPAQARQREDGAADPSLP
jgi:hypothetical protein